MFNTNRQREVDRRIEVIRAVHGHVQAAAARRNADRGDIPYCECSGCMLPSTMSFFYEPARRS